MLDFIAAHDAVKARIAEQYTAIPSARVRSWQDGVTEAPDGPVAPWAAFEALGAGSGQRGVGVPGQRLNIHRGVLMLHVFTAAGEGTAQARLLARQLAALFTYKDFATDDGGTVRTTAPRWAGAGPGDTAGKWFRVSLAVDFDLYQFF